MMNKRFMCGFGTPVLLSLFTATAQQSITRVLQNDVKVIREEYEKAYGKVEPVAYNSSNRPNILFITSDQHYWMRMGYNDSNIKTPNLNRLAQMGTIYDRAYTCNPVSTPTRASMITGLYPSQHGAYALGTKLPENVPTIGNYLSQIGYISSLVGKAHFMPLAGNAEFPSLEAYPILQDLDFWRKYNGPFYGFDKAELARNHGDESHVGQHYVLWMMQKLKKEGKDPNCWKKWFLKPGDLKYAEISKSMRKMVDENGALGTSQSGIWNIPETYHMNAWIAERANEAITAGVEKGTPFFVWASFFDPHPPYLVPEPWLSMYNPKDMILPSVSVDDLDDMPYVYRMTSSKDSKWSSEFNEDGFSIHGLNYHNNSPELLRKEMAIYYGMISMMDKYIGKILDHLEKSGQLENTMILFTTDHGHHIGTHRLTAKGAFAFEEDLRIPFIVTWKNHFPKNRRSDALVSVVDLAPTFLSIAGLKKPNSMSGLDIKELFSGKVNRIRNHVIAENHFQRTKFYQKSYIESRYKITWYMNSCEGELFDLQEDPHEFNNLWNKPKYQKIRMDLMHRALQAQMKIEPTLMPRLGPA